VSDVSVLGHVVCGVAAVGAGSVNALAGGGTLLSFPAMTAVGVPAISANATNTVSLCPGYIGGTFAQRRELTSLGGQLRAPLVVSAACGLLGSVLLVLSSEAMFRSLVPYLILASCALLAVQVPLRSWLFGRGDRHAHPAVELAAIGLASVYGGYFGAGLGIMLMAVLGLLSPLPLATVNAIKQLLSIAVNVCAAAFLVFSGKVEWTLVVVMAPCALLGGNVGGRLAGVIPAGPLRAGVVAYGTVVAIVYFVR
jgi:uncharacterized membrane protein YfcA